MQLLGAPTPQEAAALHQLIHTDSWKVLAGYLKRELNAQDAKLRGVSPDQLGRAQGAALVLSDLLMFPEAIQVVISRT